MALFLLKHKASNEGTANPSAHNPCSQTAPPDLSRNQRPGNVDVDFLLRKKLSKQLIPLCLEGHTHKIEKLLAKSEVELDLNQIREEGHNRTLLMLAAIGNSAHTADYLVEKGAYSDVLAPQLCWPLGGCCVYQLNTNEYENVSILPGADLCAVDKEGNTPIMCALQAELEAADSSNATLRTLVRFSLSPEGKDRFPKFSLETKNKKGYTHD